MKPYVPQTRVGRLRARDDIHHATFDGGRKNRAATAKAMRKAARQGGRRAAQESL